MAGRTDQRQSRPGSGDLMVTDRAKAYLRVEAEIIRARREGYSDDKMEGRYADRLAEIWDSLRDTDRRALIDMPPRTIQ